MKFRFAMKKKSVYVSSHCGGKETNLFFIFIFNLLSVFMKSSHAQMFPSE